MRFHLSGLVFALLGSVASIDVASAQDPRFHVYGEGCSWAGEECRIGNIDLPRLGRSFTITYTGPNELPLQPRRGLIDIQPHLVLGFVNALPSPLPPTAFPLQPGGCASLVDPDTALDTCDVLIVLVDHDLFKAVPLEERADKAVYDTRGIWPDQPAAVSDESTIEDRRASA